MQTTAVLEHTIEHTMENSKLAWVVTLTAALYFFYEFIQMHLFNPINPQIKEAFQLNATQLGFLDSMYFWGNVLFLFPAGMLLDRFSTRRMLLMAVTVTTLGTFSFGLAQNYYIAAVSRLAIGLGASFCFLSCIRLASRWFPPKKMAFVTGAIVTFAMFGGMIAQTPLALLSSALGWRHAVLTIAALGILVGLAISLYVQDRPPGSQEIAASDKAKLASLGFWRSIGLVLMNPQNWFGGLYTSLMNLPVFLLGAIWGIPYLEQVHHVTHIQASYATSLFFVGVIFGSLAYGKFSDTIGRRILPMVLGAVISLITMLVLIYVPNLSLNTLLFLFFAIGFVTSSQVLSYPTLAELNPRSLTSTAISVDSVTIMTSGLLCQPFFGWLLELNWDHKVIDGVSIYSAHDYQLAMLMMPISIVVALVITFFMRETYCKQQG